MTSIHPSKLTISNRINKLLRKLSKLNVVLGFGLFQLRGERNGKSPLLPTTEFEYSLMHSLRSVTLLSLHSFSRPWKMLSPHTAYGIMYKIANMAASTIRRAPEMMRLWKVERIFSISVIRRRARRALSDRVNRLRPPMKVRPVVTFTRIPARMNMSRTFQMLRTYAFGVKRNPSAMSLMINSKRSTLPKVVSAISNQLPRKSPCSA